MHLLSDLGGVLGEPSQSTGSKTSTTVSPTKVHVTKAWQHDTRRRQWFLGDGASGESWVISGIALKMILGFWLPPPSLSLTIREVNCFALPHIATMNCLTTSLKEKLPTDNEPKLKEHEH